MDPGISNTGWGFLCEGKPCMPPNQLHVALSLRGRCSGVLTTSKGRLRDKRDTLLVGVQELLDAFRPDVVAVETQVRWVGLAVAWCVCCTVDCMAPFNFGHHESPRLEHVSAREAKFSLGVKPKAGKPALKAAVLDVLGFDAPTQHEADAAAVAYCAWLRLRGGSPK